MRRTLLFAIVVAAAGVSAAPGKTGFEFLSLGGGPRTAASGGTGVARLTGGIDEVFINPAALAFSRRGEGWSSFAALPGEARLMEVGAGFPVRRFGSLGIHVQQLAHDPIPAYDGPDPAGTLKVSDTLFLATWAGPVNSFLSWGMNVKAVRERLASVTGRAEAVDIGLGGAVPGVRGLSYGVAFRNLGARGSIGGTKADLPSVVAAGVTHRSFGDAVVLSADVTKNTGRSPVFTVGGEYWLRDLVALRAGVGALKGLGSGASFGLGFKLTSNARLDYSFSPMGDFGEAHRFSLSVGFGGGRAAGYFEEGVRRLREGNDPEAVLLFDKVLTLDPSHPSAGRLLKEAGERLRGRASRYEEDGIRNTNTK